MSKVTLYGAGWCAPCTAFKPHFYEASEGYLAEDMGVVFEYQDVDEMNPEDLSHLGIMSVPTVLLDQDGELTLIKSRTKDKFELEVEYALTKD